MDFTGPYKLEIIINTPKRVNIETNFKTIYYIKNISNVNFPGGEYNINMILPQITGYFINHPLKIPELKPLQTHKIEYIDTSYVGDFIIYVLPVGYHHSSNGILTDFYEKNGNKIIPNKPIHGLRVKSMEEVYQFWANIAAFGALIISILIYLFGK